MLAGIVALAAIAVWPGLQDAARAAAARACPRGRAAPARQRRELPGLRRARRRSPSPPLAALRLWRGRALPSRTAGLYALAAVVPPLLALVLAYLRVTQFDRSISFALVAVVLAALFYLRRRPLRNVPPGRAAPATHLATGAFASGVAAAMTLAFVMVLDRGYLTVAFAVTAFTTADLRGRRPHRAAALRGGRARPDRARPPRLGPAHHGRRPRHHADLQLAAAGLRRARARLPGAARILSASGEDLAVRLCDALGVLFAALLVYFQIRHALNGGDPLAPASGHIEQGLFALTSLGFAAVLMRIDLAGANPVFRVASLAFGVVAGFDRASAWASSRTRCSRTDPVRGPRRVQLAAARLSAAGPCRACCSPGCARRAARAGT